MFLEEDMNQDGSEATEETTTPTEGEEVHHDEAPAAEAAPAESAE